MKKIKCSVCGCKFIPKKEDKYTATNRESLFSVKYIECFDCPMCGCQQKVNIALEKVATNNDEETEIDN